MNKISKSLIAAAFIFSAFTMSSCKKDDVTTPAPTTTKTPAPATETFSVMALSVKESGSNNAVIYTKTNAADTAAVVLKHGKAYEVSVIVYDKNRTLNIEATAATHRFYFEPSANSNITVIGLNNDNNSLPVGNNSKWVTEVSGSGTVHIVLRSYLKADEAKAADDDSNNSKSSTAIDVTFNTRVI